MSEEAVTQTLINLTHEHRTHKVSYKTNFPGATRPVWRATHTLTDTCMSSLDISWEIFLISVTAGNSQPLVPSH